MTVPDLKVDDQSSDGIDKSYEILEFCIDKLSKQSATSIQSSLSQLRLSLAEGCLASLAFDCLVGINPSLIVGQVINDHLSIGTALALLKLINKSQSIVPFSKWKMTKLKPLASLFSNRMLKPRPSITEASPNSQHVKQITMKSILLFNSEKELAFRMMLETGKQDKAAILKTKSNIGLLKNQISALEDVIFIYF